jgi:hypothetical protein
MIGTAMALMALVPRVGVVAVMLLFGMLLRILIFVVATGTGNPPHTVTDRGSKASPKEAPVLAGT